MAILNKFRFASIGLLTLLLACNIINPKEDIPVYISVNSFTLNAGVGQGTNSSKITDAWVFVNDDLLGAFELPGTIPLLADGNKTIKVFAGIKENGSSATRSIYPFYSTHEQEVTLKEGTHITIDPTINYGTNAVFEFVEDFEAGTVFATTTGTDCFSIEASAAFEGSRGVLMTFDPSATCEITTSNTYALPSSGAPIYLEMNYKSEIAFEIGLNGKYGNNTVADYTHVINASDDWNKIYLNLTDQIKTWAGTLGTNAYQIKIRAVNPSDAVTAKLYLDNLKLLH